MTKQVPTSPVRVLFVCVHNAARSQMAEALANQLGEGRVAAESAGRTPTEVNTLAIEAMADMGIDISGKKARNVFDLFRTGELYSFVIAVCDESQLEECPVFPGITQRLSWSFPDPASFTGTHEQKLAQTIKVRDQIRDRIVTWLAELS